MRPGRLVRRLFCMAASITAAAVVDPILERFSNAGVFGPGTFTDHSNLDVLPAASLGAALGALFVYLAVRRLLTPGARPAPWLRRCAEQINARSCVPLLPAIFGIQLAVLFSMETVEQVAVAGHPLGGAIWLGAPVVVSLLAHAAGCIAVTFALLRVLNWSAKSIARVVRLALEFVRALLDTRDAPRLPRVRRARVKFIEPYLRGLQGRAPPPSLPVPTH